MLTELFRTEGPAAAEITVTSLLESRPLAKKLLLATDLVSGLKSHSIVSI